VLSIGLMWPLVMGPFGMSRLVPRPPLRFPLSSPSPDRNIFTSHPKPSSCLGGRDCVVAKVHCAIMLRFLFLFFFF
jgi:hypothetical protein